MVRYQVFHRHLRRLIFLCTVGALLLANSGIISPSTALAQQRVTAQQQSAHSALKQHGAQAPSPTQHQPVIFVHGINENANHMGESDFAPLYSALQPIAGSVQTFYYVDDLAYADTHSCPPKFTPCISQSAVLDNAIKLAGMISDLYQKTQHQITLIGYSMGAAIIRTALSGCQTNVTCQAVLGPRIASMVNNVFFIDGVQQGSWMMQSKKGGIIPAAVAFLRQFISPLFKLLLGSDVNANAEKDLAPQSINIDSHNSTLPAKNIHYFNFYGNIVLNLKISTLFSTTVIPIDIGDGVVLPGTDNPQDTPLWGGARFCLQCNGQNASQIDAGTTYRQWPLTVEKFIDLANQCTPLSVIQHDCVLGSLFDLLTNTPQFHTNMSSAASLDGAAIQVADTTGLSGSKTTSIANEIALQLQVMPPTQTSCPASGTARAMVSGLLLLGNHQNLVLSTGIDLQRYDTSTGTFTTVVQFNAGTISEAQLSADGAWILFVNQVGGQSAIQMVRVHGQGLQTLHCAPVGQSIFNLSWSPDQKQVAFDEGNDFLSESSSLTGSADTYLLQLNTGKLQRVLIQPLPPNSQTSPYVSGYFPLYWIDNTRLYMREYVRCCVDDPLGGQLYLLDTSQGTDQQVSNMHLLTRLGAGSFEGIALAPDRSKLFLSQCSCAFPAGTGPSPITEQSPTGGNANTIYTDSASAITSMVIIDQSSLLVLVESYANAVITIDTSQNGLWRINTDGSGWTRLTTDNANQGTTLNTATQYSWANISRDGTSYAAQTTTYTSNTTATFSLYIGSVQGGATKSIYGGSGTSTTGNLQSGFSIIGWTTM
jgi:pimeloyl-ACP methyl ester carboxylesterase